MIDAQYKGKPDVRTDEAVDMENLIDTGGHWLAVAFLFCWNEKKADLNSLNIIVVNLQSILLIILVNLCYFVTRTISVDNLPFSRG